MGSRVVSLSWTLDRIESATVQCRSKPDCSPGPTPCFPFWQELLACYVVNTVEDDISGAKKCLPAMEDYYECLHHKKEVGSECSREIISGFALLGDGIC